MTTFSEQATIVYSTLTCGVCGVPFAMTRDMFNRAIEQGVEFYCPNGHSLAYKISENAKLKSQVGELERQLRVSKCETMAEKNKREAAEKAAERKMKRVKNGVCPCCNRSFQNLQRHMKTKHPEKTE